MKKLSVLLVLLLCLCGCSNSNTASSSADLNEEIVSYFDKYDDTMSMGDENGYVYCFDDGTDFGVALVVKYNDEQKEEYNNLSFDSDTYFEDLETIAKKSTDYEIINLNELGPDQSELDAYVGKTIGDMMDEGYEEWGYMVDDSSATFSLQNDKYLLNVTVNQKIDEDDLSVNYERSLVIDAVEFGGISDDYFYTLIDD